MSSLTGTGIFVRLAGETDKETLLVWRNNPIVARYSKTGSTITAEDHSKWFEGRQLTLNESPIFIFSQGQVPVGMTRLDLIEKEPLVFELSILVDDRFQNAGLGKQMLEYTCETATNLYAAKTIQAYIHKDNLPSQKLFLRLGFSKKLVSDEVFSLYELIK